MKSFYKNILVVTVICLQPLLSWGQIGEGAMVDCLTVENISYQCGSDFEKIKSILKVMKPFSAKTYTFGYDNQGRDMDIDRSFTQFSVDGETPSFSYFQDYIWNRTKNRFHIYHFVKNESGDFDVYQDRDQFPSGNSQNNMTMVSNNLEKIGTTESFDADNSDGLVGNHTLFTTFSSYNQVEHNGNFLTLVGRHDNATGEIWWAETYYFLEDVIF